MTNYQYKEDFEVRDYECDSQGIVNNANYLHYLEHARHKILHNLDIDYSTLLEKGIYLVVIRIEIDYLFPLHSGDRFYVGTNIERVSRLRFGFLQDIFRIPDQKPIVKAKVIGTSLNTSGRPILPTELDRLL